MAGSDQRRIHRFDDLAWEVPGPPGVDPGVGRKRLAQGEAGFFTQVVRFPPGFEAPVHSHDHAEVFVVLDGSCTFDGAPMRRWDLTVVEADEPYGITAGPDGVQFLVVRTGAAAATLVDPVS